MHILYRLVLTSFFMLTIYAIGFSQDESHEQTKGKHHENHYHLSAFAGFTTDYKGRTGYKLGLEYEQRLNDYFGIGGTFDFTGADFRIFAFSLGTTIYPFKKIPLVFAVAGGAKNAKDDKWKGFFRTMAAYDFHIGDFSIGPMVMWDVFKGDKNIMSYGVTVGYSLH